MSRASHGPHAEYLTIRGQVVGFIAECPVHSPCSLLRIETWQPDAKMSGSPSDGSLSSDVCHRICRVCICTERSRSLVHVDCQEH